MDTDLLKQKAIQLQRQIDMINEDVLKLKKQEELYRNKISDVKKEIEKANSHFIGKTAICSELGSDTFQNKPCVCTGVMCTDDFNIKPLFSNKNGKRHVDIYEWIN